MTIRSVSVLAAGAFCLGLYAQSGEVRPPSATALSDPRLGKLPPALHSQGLALLKETDEAKRAAAVQALVRSDATGSRDFLLDLLEQEPSARVRSAVVERLASRDSPALRQALERAVASDPDPKVSVLALEKLRLLQAQSLIPLVEKRLTQARQAGSDADLRLLAREHERSVTLARGARLPGFMQVPPPVFSVKPAGRPIRVLAFGDYGQGTVFQKEVAAALLRYHRTRPFDFAVTLGDNFYPRGMESPSDPRWKTLWSELYDPLGIRFYVTLGNHDWGFPDSPAAEVLYTQKSPAWRLPATRYTFTAGPVQFFATDTQAMSEAQLLWLRDELDQSKARWKVVYGHHPIYSHGAHGDTRNLIRDLLPLLKERADVHLAGHEHDLQHLKPEGSLHFFISGGAGAGIRPITPGPRSLFAKSSYGFAVLEADARALKVTFVDTDLNPLYEYTLRK